MKNKKGVTLITLVITVVVLIILVFTISMNIQPYNNQSIKKNFETDIRNLKEEIDQYYARHKKLPIINKYRNTQMLEESKNTNDNSNYYVIDIKQLEVELNYGKDYDAIERENSIKEITDMLDVYIINEESHTIYYPLGVSYDEEIHYRLPEIS